MLTSSMAHFCRIIDQGAIGVSSRRTCVPCSRSRAMLKEAITGMHSAIRRKSKATIGSNTVDPRPANEPAVFIE